MAARTPAGRTPASLWYRLAGWAGGVLAVLVVGLHGYLLWQRVADLTLFEPAVGLCWLIGLLLVAAVLRLRASGLSLLRGRRALVFWLVVLILHSGLPGSAGGLGAAEGELPVLALTLAAVWLALALAGRLAVGGSRARRARFLPPAPPVRTPADGSLSLLSRPPPALSLS